MADRGLPSGIEPADYFGYELVGFGADTGPRFKEEVISIDDEYIVERDSYGGAPSTEEYAREIGADATAKDAVEGVRIVAQWSRE